MPLEKPSAATDPCPVGLRGIVPSLNTPFTVDDRIDVAALRRLVDVTVNAGCAGMLICAVAGETGSLSPAERETVMRTVLEQTAGRIPVIVGVTHPDAATRVALARQAKAAGAPWMLCQPPAGLRGHALLPVFQTLADYGPEALMIQDLDFTGPGMTLEDIAMLFETVPAFRALKIETLPAGPKYSQVLEATGGRLHVSGGWAVMQMLEALRRGVHAFIPSTLDPVYCAIHRRFHAGDEAGARALFEQALPILAFAHSHIDVSIRFFKQLRHAEGIFPTDRVRPPVPPLDPFQQREADRLVARALELQGSLAVKV